MKNKAFTLIELLVVVLIIGILAAIAVPQYQVAVAKSEYSNLKAMTKAIAQAVHTYDLANGQQPTSFKDLDISVPSDNLNSLWVNLKNGFGACKVWPDSNRMVACYTNKTRGFYIRTTNLKPLWCYCYPNDNICEKLCQQETGKTERSMYSTNSYILYAY